MAGSTFPSALRLAALFASLLGLAGPALAAPPSHPVAQKAPKKKPKGKAPKGPTGGFVQPPAPPGPGPKEPADRGSRKPSAPPLVLERLTLDNGLRVVLAPDKRSPTVAVSVVYDAGSRNEDRGSSGLARVVEHLMTQGSANVLRGDHERLLGQRGGQSRSLTASDRTAFVDLAPSSELPLLLWLEADRLKSLQITPEAFASQREVVIGELRREVAGSALGAARTRLRELVFQASWPYEHDPRGSIADLLQLRPEAARGFYETFYTASNAVLTVTGDFELEHATQLVHRFFETARKQDRPPPFVPPPPPEQTSQRSATIEDGRQHASAMLFGWAGPPARTDDSHALAAALAALADGPASRLGQRLMGERAVATRVSPSVERQRGDDLVSVEIELVDDGQRAEAQKILDQELDALARSGPTEAELARFRAAAEASTWRSFLAPDERAVALGEAELLHGDARLLEEELPRAFAVTRDRARAAAGRYLGASRRTLIEVVAPREPEPPSPKAGPKPSPGPQPAAPAAPAAPPHGHKKPPAKPHRPKAKH